MLDGSKVSSPCCLAQLRTGDGGDIVAQASKVLQVPPDERRALRFFYDLHPTPRAHRVLAESLARSVEPFMAERAPGTG